MQNDEEKDSMCPNPGVDVNINNSTKSMFLFAVYLLKRTAQTLNLDSPHVTAE